MKKLIFTIAFIATGLVATAQVGIGNVDPKVTLHVTGTNDNGAVTAVDGILVPRVNDADMSTAIDGTEDGQMVYNTVAKAFYYWNGTAWTAVGGAAKYQNIGGNVQTMDGNSTILDTTYFVIFQGITTGILTTPTPVAGKTFWVKNIGTATAGVAGQNINSGRMRAFVSDGTLWYPSNQ